MDPLGAAIVLLVSLLLFALPSAGFSYLLIVVGRRLYGLIGMKVAVSVSALLAAAPLAVSSLEAMAWLSASGPVYADQIKGILLFAGIGLGALTGLGAVLFFRWHEQASKAG